jgi:hypothetical protein
MNTKEGHTIVTLNIKDVHATSMDKQRDMMANDLSTNLSKSTLYNLAIAYYLDHVQSKDDIISALTNYMQSGD